MRRRQLLVLLVLSTMLVAGCSAGLADAPSTSPTTSSPPSPSTGPGKDRQLSLLVIGDSYAAGVGADARTTSFAWQLGRDLGADTSVDAVGGTGFVNPGPNGIDQRYASRLPTLTAAQLASTVIVVEGGLNDRAVPTADIRTAAREFLAELVTSAPTAEVVLVGATAPVPAVPADSVAVNTALAEAAAGYDVTFVDPVGLEWFTEENAGVYVSSDQLHPTQAGHDFLARRIAETVRSVLGD